MLVWDWVVVVSVFWLLCICVVWLDYLGVCVCVVCVLLKVVCVLFVVWFV